MKKLDHIVSIDGLRGLACLMVMFFHLSQARGENF
jgi:peptidoglycan/LPS O-acetylase OafA/YrhL